MLCSCRANETSNASWLHLQILLDAGPSYRSVPARSWLRTNTSNRTSTQRVAADMPGIELIVYSLSLYKYFLESAALRCKEAARKLSSSGVISALESHRPQSWLPLQMLFACLPAQMWLSLLNLRVLALRATGSMQKPTPSAWQVRAKSATTAIPGSQAESAKCWQSMTLPSFMNRRLKTCLVQSGVLASDHAKCWLARCSSMLCHLMAPTHGPLHSYGCWQLIIQYSFIYA